MSSLLSLEYELQPEADKLMNLAYIKVLRTLKKEVAITSVYDLAKIFRKNGETDLQRDCYRFILKLYKERPN